MAETPETAADGKRLFLVQNLFILENNQWEDTGAVTLKDSICR
jgi:hypothetical protein